MDRFDRQTRITGWDQKLLQNGRVAVSGRDWLGAFTVWALASLGVGEILWIGEPCSSSESLARWFLARPCPFTECKIYDYPFQIEYGSELNWPLEHSRTNALVCCSEDPLTQLVCQSYARDHHLKYFSGTTARGGWYGTGTPPYSDGTEQNPVVAMTLAAILADAVRETLCPLSQGLLPLNGELNMQMPATFRPSKAILIGVGGIGVYAAFLAAVLGHEICLIDFDQVEESNLNRQGLFTPFDAQARSYKAAAARDSLQRLFPASSVSAKIQRVDKEFLSEIANMDPSVVLSAVDNASTRYLLGSLSGQMGLPLIQGGTDIFAADCYTQENSGPPLDDQMHGALSDAAEREAKKRKERHGCGCAGDPSYVVPGMMAGALMMYRMVQVCEHYSGLQPIRWRSGSLPVEERNVFDGFDTTKAAA